MLLELLKKYNLSVDLTDTFIRNYEELSVDEKNDLIFELNRVNNYDELFNSDHKIIKDILKAHKFSPIRINWVYPLS